MINAAMVAALPGYVGALVIAVVVVLLAFLFVSRRLFQKRTAGGSIIDPQLRLDISQLDPAGPSSAGPQLEYYGTPVRLAVLVLAPSGRGSQVPGPERLRGVVELLVPGLAEVLDHHRPVFRVWPEQLSSQGFANSFSTHIELPGDNGKGTPWCAVAGKFDIGEGQLLAGLVCRALKPNGLGQVVVQHEGMWNDVLRVRMSNE